jgi:hypothetical protein
MWLRIPTETAAEGDLPVSPSAPSTAKRLRNHVQI